MKLFFSAPELDAQLLRTIGYTCYGGADIGECFNTIAHISPDDFDTWYTAWKKTAERVFSEGQHSLDAGNSVSARSSFLRASNYFRTAMIFLYGAPVDERLIEMYDLHVQSFKLATSLFDHPVHRVEIPFENTALPAYLFLASHSSEKKPVVIINGGYDTTLEEGYWSFGAAALARGYHVLSFDGPGQGELLIKQNMHMRPNWETVITPIINFLETRAEVDTKAIALYGPSWGGYLAPRAACFEHRIQALIVNPGQVDALYNIKKAFPTIVEQLNAEDYQPVEQFLVNVLSEKMMALRFRSKMWVHGVDSPVELLKEWRHYNLRESLSLIECPTFIADSEGDPFCAGQAQQLYDGIHSPKAYHLFTTAEGAGEYCEAGALSLLHSHVFDWLSGLNVKILF